MEIKHTEIKIHLIYGCCLHVKSLTTVSSSPFWKTSEETNPDGWGGFVISRLSSISGSFQGAQEVKSEQWNHRLGGAAQEQRPRLQQPAEVLPTPDHHGGAAVSHHLPAGSWHRPTHPLPDDSRTPHGSATALPASFPSKHHFATARRSALCELPAWPCPPGALSCEAWGCVFPGVFSLWILTTSDRWFPDKELEFKETYNYLSFKVTTK